MKKPDRRPRHSCNLERSADQPTNKRRARHLKSRIRRTESVAERPVQNFKGRRIRPDVDRALFDLVESAQIIQSHDVISVGMSENDSVNHVDIVAKTLNAKLRRGVDEHLRPMVRNAHTRPIAMVARIITCAYRAMTADHRHAGAGACSQKQQFNLRHNPRGYRLKSHEIELPRILAIRRLLPAVQMWTV